MTLQRTVELRPVGRDENRRRGGQRRREGRKDIVAGRIDPMRVLEYEHDPGFDVELCWLLRRTLTSDAFE